MTCSHQETSYTCEFRNDKCGFTLHIFSKDDQCLLINIPPESFIFQDGDGSCSFISFLCK